MTFVTVKTRTVNPRLTLHEVPSMRGINNIEFFASNIHLNKGFVVITFIKYSEILQHEQPVACCHRL